MFCYYLLIIIAYIISVWSWNRFFRFRAIKTLNFFIFYNAYNKSVSIVNFSCKNIGVCCCYGATTVIASSWEVRKAGKLLGSAVNIVKWL